MANRRLSFIAGFAGLSAGLAPYLPTVCAGGVCTSCFACVGAGGAAASALVVGFVARRIGRRRADDTGVSTSSTTGGRIES